MKNIKFFLIVLAALLLSTCEKPERNNPWDENNTLNPEEWAPQNFRVEDVTPLEKKLTWTYEGDDRIEGFKLDRKRGDELLKVNFQTFPKTQRAYIDTISLNPAIYYYYRLYAYAGQNTSAAKETSTIPPPENLTITVNSATSVTLNWSYSHTGHEGFKIERKIDNGSWEMLSDNLYPNQNSFNDNGLDLSQHDYTYRIYAFFDVFQSTYVEEMANYIPSIGEIYKGGIVFYLNGNGGGLVCAESDQSTGAPWGCYGTIIGGTGTGIGTGAANTAAIVAGCSQSGIAARICSDLVLNGYSDWFLPSRDELNLMYQNLKLVGIGGFADYYYWSSSEYSSDITWVQDFDSGSQVGGGKTNYESVRAVRAF